MREPELALGRGDAAVVEVELAELDVRPRRRLGGAGGGVDASFIALIAPAVWPISSRPYETRAYDERLGRSRFIVSKSRNAAR